MRATLSPEQRATIVESVVAGGLVLIGFTIGAPHQLTPLIELASAAGGNWVSDLAERGFAQWRQRWLQGEATQLSPVASALRDSLRDAITQLEKEWLHHPHYLKLRHRNQAPAESTLSALESLRQDADAVLEHGKPPREPFAMVATAPLPMTDAHSASAFLKVALANYLFDYDAQFAEFVQTVLPAIWVRRFDDIVLRQDDRGTAAWREIQQLYEASLRDAVLDIRTEGRATQEKLTALDQWIRAFLQTPIERRDQVAREALRAAIDPLDKQLAEIARGIERIESNVVRLRHPAKSAAVGPTGPRGKPIGGGAEVPEPPPQKTLGRTNERQKIRRLLGLRPEEMAPDIPPVALVGTGGIGKSTLAIDVGRSDRIRGFFPDGVLWAELGPKPQLRQRLNSWGWRLGVDLRLQRDDKSRSSALRDVLFDRRCLLLVDDVWDLRHALLFHIGGPRCRIVFTTRNAGIASHLALPERSLSLSTLSPRASLALLSRLAPTVVKTDERRAAELCSQLGQLPLALKLAGQLLASKAAVPSLMQRTLDELIERREARLQLLQAEGRLGLEEDHPVTLEAILGMSV